MSVDEKVKFSEEIDVVENEQVLPRTLLATPKRRNSIVMGERYLPPSPKKSVELQSSNALIYSRNSSSSGNLSNSGKKLINSDLMNNEQQDVEEIKQETLVNEDDVMRSSGGIPSIQVALTETLNTCEGRSRGYILNLKIIWDHHSKLAITQVFISQCRD